MSGLLTGRRILVTGGASGIGAAAVDRMADDGARGVVLDLPNAIAELDGPWPGVAADVTDESELAVAVDSAVGILGRLDGVVACAGVVPAWHRTAEWDLAEWDRVFAINVRGIAATLKLTAPQLTSGATVTVVGSLNSWRGDPNIAAYAASKHAVLGVIRSAAIDLGRDGIRVNAVGPGPVATAALLARLDSRAVAGGLPAGEALAAAAAGTALGRIATVEQVADVVVFLTSELSAAVTGQLIAVDGGLL